MHMNATPTAKHSGRIDPAALAAGVIAADRTAIGRAITLVESRNPAHRTSAREMLTLIAPHAGGSQRVGITGVPGVGKSTFIDAFGDGDTLYGGDGHGIANYSAQVSAFSIRLSTETSPISGDVLIDIEEVIAGAGDDTLEGDSNANILSGGAGADSLIAVAGDDTLIGGLGADSLVGGTGNDVFQGTAAELNTDYIFDFGPADRLDITDLQSNSILTLSGDGRVDIDLNGDGVVDSTLHVFAQTGGFLVVDDLGEIAYQADLPDEPAPPAPSPAPDNTQSGPEGLGVSMAVSSRTSATATLASMLFMEI